jgi:arylsulfatase
VDRDGEYEIELRRWPREADAAMAAGLPPYPHTDGTFPAGAALSIAKARLRIADFDQSRPVLAADKAVTFATRLKAGRAQLQTWLSDADGRAICGAYYVYVNRK